MKKRKTDPHAAREARRYEKPIVSREFILQYLSDHGAPLSPKRLVKQLDISDEQQVDALHRRVRAMERDGQLVANRRGELCIVNSEDLITGRVIGHKDGFGFLHPEAGGDDLFLSPRQMRSLMHEDRVVVRISGIDRRGRREGAVVEVLERNTPIVVGRFFREGGINFVSAEDKRQVHDILIPQGEEGNAKNGQIVAAEIVEFPNHRRQPIGRITEVIGDHMAPGMEIDVAIRAHGLPAIWPDEVEDEIAGLKPEVPASAWKGRVDLRDTPLVTIDGADSRDFDDAVFCEPRANGWRLLVAIADVSSYVIPGTALDKEGYNRGNSVYFPNNVIPMLPEVLSNGLCSLNPQVDRLCLVAEMYINQEGNITRSRFMEAVMCSHARFTYDEVASILVDRDEGVRGQHQALVPHLESLYDLYHCLRAAREVRGAIDFETTETRIVFNDDRKIDAIVPVVRNDAHKVIEECMIAANVAAGRFLARHKMPCQFRVHEGPSAERLLDLREFLGEMGLSLRGGAEPEPGDYASLLRQVENRPDAHLIQTVLLRSLAQAVYSPDNKGHFGLAHETYAHFTSPIRRYPDLLVHRGIRHVLSDGKPDTFDYSSQEFVTAGEHCSTTERRADEATRDVMDWLKCEFMMEHVGDEYVGTVVGVTSFGLFVELDESYVTGLVHVTVLKHDYYKFDPTGHRLRGERSGQVYRLADRIEVRIVQVNLDDRRIELELASGGSSSADDAGNKRPGKKKRRKKKSGANLYGAGSGDSKDSEDKPRKKKAKKKTKTKTKAKAKPKGVNSGGQNAEKKPKKKVRKRNTRSKGKPRGKKED